MASRWYPGRQDETEGRWACHLSLFYAMERVPDAINVLQVHGHNVQYSRGRLRPRRRGASGATRGPARLAVPGTAFIVAAPAVAAQPNPPGARPVRPSFRRHRLCRRGAPGAARGVISQSAPPPPLRPTRSNQTAPPPNPPPQVQVSASRAGSTRTRTPSPAPCAAPSGACTTGRWSRSQRAPCSRVRTARRG